MDATATRILDQSDSMSVSSLVRLSDWELAYLRVAMIKKLQEQIDTALEPKVVAPVSDPRRAGRRAERMPQAAVAEATR